MQCILNKHDSGVKNLKPGKPVYFLYHSHLVETYAKFLINCNIIGPDLASQFQSH